ncbi:G5 domain-containing protein [Microbacterium sp. YY-03]|uniref:G5 domain-containing protein n=1 Tax=Microbacterium sp. YY-03 TaxID=3421636 RepID=UPI003D16D926
MTHDPMTPLTPPSAVQAPDADPTRSLWGPLARLPLWARGAIVAAVVVLAILLWQLTATFAVVVLITAIVAVAKNRPTWLKFASPRQAKVAIVVATVVAFAFSSVGTAVAGSTNSSNNSPAGFVAMPSETPSTTTQPSQSAQSAAKPSKAPSPQPSPTPVIEKKQVSVTEEIPYATSQQEDWNLESGLTQVAVAGVAGTRTITYEVTYTDGVETARVEVSNLVTTEPIHEVVSVGMYTPPAAFAGSADNGCNPNYADACVPNDPVDVDCAWGTGDGPSYFDGVARVVGSDVYGLDRDKDGYACERD